MVNHNLCGDLTYKPYYKDENRPLESVDPITYDESKLQFTVDSDDDGLSDTIESYGVNVEFINWPRSEDNPIVSTATNGANVEYDNPCNNPTIGATI